MLRLQRADQLHRQNTGNSVIKIEMGNTETCLLYARRFSFAPLCHHGADTRGGSALNGLGRLQ